MSKMEERETANLKTVEISTRLEASDIIDLKITKTFGYVRCYSARAVIIPVANYDEAVELVEKIIQLRKEEE